MNKRTMDKYLTKAFVCDIEPAPQRKFKGAVVIPAYAESDYLPDTVRALAANNAEFLRDVMLLIVVNNPADGDNSKLEDNRVILEALRRGEFELKGLSLFWIDASSPGKEISAKGGVGAARKLGMDSALKFLDWNNEPLLFCLDADTLVEPNYIEVVFDFFRDNPGDPSAVVKFSHQLGQNASENNAIVDYELFMRYYVAALKYSGSPYAYHALGSAIVCRAEAYVRAGGMRVKNGGEDFYFLQALRKCGVVGNVTGTCVYPSSRPSDRVPFGTGPKIREIIDGKDMTVYNPGIFDVLRVLYKFAYSASLVDFENLAENFKELFPVEITDFLCVCGFESSWRKILKNTPASLPYARAAFDTWFDAFRTLKFMHFCEKHFLEKYPRMNALCALKKLIKNAPESAFESKSNALEWLKDTGC